MMKRTIVFQITIAIAFVLLSTANVKGDVLFTTDDGLAAYQTGITTLTNSPNYDWWYGCSPTSAGMIMGYYDRNGYDGGSGLELYPNLVPGATAETNTFGNPGAAVNQAIASTGYQHDFYNASNYGYNTGGGIGNGYGESVDDVATPTHSFDCLADFMGTSQDGMAVPILGQYWDNVNGGTTFWYGSDGSPMSASDIAYYETHGYAGILESSGMYGIGEYVSYAGYDVTTLYNQYIDTQGLSDGFTFDDYCAEIDAGRPVLIHTENHTMFGYGYDGTDTVYLYDTWNDLDGAGGPYLDGQNPGTMTWGGIYGGVYHVGVTVLEIAGGVLVPIPAAIFLGILGLGVVGVKLRKYA